MKHTKTTVSIYIVDSIINKYKKIQFWMLLSKTEGNCLHKKILFTYFYYYYIMTPCVKQKIIFSCTSSKISFLSIYIYIYVYIYIYTLHQEFSTAVPLIWSILNFSLIPHSFVIHCLHRASSIQYGYRKYGTLARVSPTTLAHGNSKNQIRQRNEWRRQVKKRDIKRSKACVKRRSPRSPVISRS